jgi:hypothetical protein
VNLRIRNRPDFLAGLLFSGLGLVALVGALDYPMGTARNIGPGYFPVLLGGVLVALGAATAIKAFAADPQPVGRWAIGPAILVTAAVIAFALLVRPLGLAVATAALVGISSFSGGNFRLSRVILLSLGLIALSAAIFVYTLGLPFRIWPI